MTDISRDRVAIIEAGSPGLNIYSHVAMGRGAALLTTVIRDSGYDARAFIEDISGKDSIDWEFVRSAKVVGFSTITCTLPRTRELVAKTREVNPDAVIVFGGPEPTCNPDRSIDAGADYILRGEAELTLPQLLGRLRGQTADRLRDIPGLVWESFGRRFQGPPPRQLTGEELDALPLVDRSLIHDATQASVAPVWRTRGCPERCDFCEVCEIWPRYTRRSDENSLDELVEAQTAGYPTAFLIDDNAAANKPAFKEFLRSAGKRGFARMLVTQLRADAVLTRDGRLDRELLRLLRKAASVTVVCIGVESAEDANLEQLHKKIDSSAMARSMRAMKRYGLLVHGMFMALPGDTREIVRRNGEYARRYVTSLQYLFETPLPGTKRTAAHEACGAIMFNAAEDLEFYDGMHVVLRPEKMGPREMQELMAEQYRRFYSRRRVVAAALRGAFARFRRLSEAQRAYLRQLEFKRRLRQWAMFHIEYKFAPVSFLAIGYSRIRRFMRDPDYERYLSRLDSM